MTAASQRLVAYACLAASMAIVGSYVAMSKALVIVFPVFLLAGLRFGIAAVAMAPWLRKPADEAPLDGRTRWLLFAESFFGNFLFSVCMLYGVARTTALAAGIILASLPAMVAILSRLLLRERIAPRTWLGIAFAVGGIAIVSLSRAGGDDDALDTGTLVGNALLFGAVTCEALYVVIGKQLTAGIGPRRISALINGWGLLLVAPFALWQAADFPWRFIGGTYWALLVAYAVLASIVTVWLWMTGLRHVPASQAGVFTVFLPIAAAAVGVGVFGEVVSGAQAVAFALALVGVVLATRRGGLPSRVVPTT